MNADTSGPCAQGRQNRKPLFIFSSISGSAPDKARGGGTAPHRGCWGGPCLSRVTPSPGPAAWLHPPQCRGLVSTLNPCCNLPGQAREAISALLLRAFILNFFVFAFIFYVCIFLIFCKYFSFALFKIFCTFFIFAHF